LKSPALQDRAFLESYENVPAQTDQFDLWWMGQSGFLIKWQDRGLLFDPYLSDSLTIKYAETDKPHNRMVKRVIDPVRLTDIAVATSSHNHTDHLDTETLHALLKTNPNLRLVLPEANIEFAEERLGNKIPDLVGLDEGKMVQAAGFEFHAVAAAHNEIKKDGAGRNHYIGFIVKFADWTIYHSGDTLWHEGLVQTLMEHEIDIALVPINGSKKERRVAGNLNGTEAAALAKAIGARIAIPHHFDMFDFNTETPEEFRLACERLNQPYKILQNGQHIRSTTIKALKKIEVLEDN
jgi:L-ascorbate metabolism protein UlaG (beta-lactamase superfamily)